MGWGCVKRCMWMWVWVCMVRGVLWVRRGGAAVMALSEKLSCCLDLCCCSCCCWSWSFQWWCSSRRELLGAKMRLCVSRQRVLVV